MQIAVLGTGLMGSPMVRRLAAAGYELHVWNRNAARAQPLANCATIHAEPMKAVQAADVVICMLLDGVATREVLLGLDVLNAMQPGSTLIDMGSVDPATDIALAEAAKDRNVAFLDAPVSGGVVGAEAGTLSIFVGGDVDTVSRVAPVLSKLGRPTHVGPVGAGQGVKLANQVIVAGTIAAVAEGLRLAEGAGCDPAIARQALAGGFADSRILELHGARMVAGEFTPGGRSAAQLKDLDNAMDLAQSVSLDLPALRQVQTAFRDLVEHHDGAELDHSAYYEWLLMR
ncbi:NAD(P)-dependent oxidoreductase [Pontivivens insulae]|uniref:2-hydroxy-3-oxopropionate reductase n=1 Tax=Pontivivens insulae TaxID=1639689 RepID=A0A2R8A6Y1_9RHOB|nr:NAD(P)-dependent oxidoreductase [Pontivivens insulae]RED18058.1 2-hydroxy-3-oxopropionate reductase [Pontivivens insulae]SPF27955.1 2-hydroxy-3-oxopropionate reductase [Pontivivens insulae]